MQQHKERVEKHLAASASEEQKVSSNSSYATGSGTIDLRTRAGELDSYHLRERLGSQGSEGFSHYSQTEHLRNSRQR